MRILEDEFHIQQEHILDILDQDELSRIEKEDDYLLIIVRLPVFVPDADVSYFTIPLGIILYENMFITICWTDCEVLKDISSNRLKGLNLSDFPALLTRILSRADTIFLRYLKEINRRSTTIQNELQLSIKNIELIQLSNLEKSLVYFTTSLKSNQLLLEKLSKTRYLTFDEDDRDWLEGVEIDNRQAIEMTDTYSDILSGMMDAFASVISNNLNIVMKKLFGCQWRWSRVCTCCHLLVNHIEAELVTLDHSHLVDDVASRLLLFHLLVNKPVKHILCCVVLLLDCEVVEAIYKRCNLLLVYQGLLKHC
jgi:magnesium transporter